MSLLLNQGRRSIRLARYDYAGPGTYFVTVCVQKKKCLWGDVIGRGNAAE